MSNEREAEAPSVATQPDPPRQGPRPACICKWDTGIDGHGVNCPARYWDEGLLVINYLTAALRAAQARPVSEDAEKEKLVNTAASMFGGGPMTLTAFADKHGLTLKITERSKAFGLPRFMADFEKVEIGGDGMLRSSYGNGNTPEEAVAAFARKIEGQHLVFHAYGDDRREFDVPNELHVENAIPTSGAQAEKDAPTQSAQANASALFAIGIALNGIAAGTVTLDQAHLQQCVETLNRIGGELLRAEKDAP